MDEEVVLLEEQLATAHADIDRLQTELAELAARDAERDAEAQAMRAQLQAARGEAEAARSQLSTQEEESRRLREALDRAEMESREALSRYRDAALEREPQLPADMVSGGSVSELDAAIERARQTVAQVRQHLEQQAQAARVPAGAPARGGPDTSELSESEKIRLGLAENR